MTDKKEPAIPTADPRHPPEEIAHKADMKRRAEARAKKQPKLREMLNADAAADEEAVKGKRKYEVSCTINERSGSKMTSGEKTGVVSAQNEDDAWAVFCDQMGTWPSPKWCDRKIVEV